MLWPKKIHTRNLMTKKNSCGSKIPLPSITFLMVRPLRRYREDSFGSKTGDNVHWMDLHVRPSLVSDDHQSKTPKFSQSKSFNLNFSETITFRKRP